MFLIPRYATVIYFTNSLSLHKTASPCSKISRVKRGVGLHYTQGSVREVWSMVILFVLTLVRKFSDDETTCRGRLVSESFHNIIYIVQNSVSSFLRYMITVGGNYMAEIFICDNCRLVIGICLAINSYNAITSILK